MSVVTASYLRYLRFTLNWATDRASAAFTMATSSSDNFSFSRASARRRASSALASSIRSAATDYLPRKADDDCLQELRWIYDRRDAQEARRDLAAWLLKWGKR